MPPAGYDDRPISGRLRSGGSASDFEAELASVAAEDERSLAETRELERQYALEMEDAQNRDRTRNRVTEMAKSAAKEALKREAKVIAKTAAKKVAKSAAVNAARSVIVATAPYWASALALIAAIILVFVVVLVVLDYKCNESGIKGFTFRAASTIGDKLGYVPVDVCENMVALRTSLEGVSGPASVSPDPAGPRGDLVTVTGHPMEDVSNPQARPCLVELIDSVMLKAQSAGLSLAITSLYRPGAMTATGYSSAHSRGEAVDFSLRPRISWDTVRSGDPAALAQIDALVNIVRDEFLPLGGDYVDEYRFPSGNASAPHVHAEFNAGYCDQNLPQGE